MLKKFLKWATLLLAVLIAVLAVTGYWYLSWDELAPPDMPGVVKSDVLEHDGLERHWMAYVPASRGDSPALVIVLHGSRSDGNAVRTGTFYSFDVQAERNGFVAVYPTGFDQHWNDCRGSAAYQANLQNVDDVGFLRALVVEMAGRYGVDTERVFVTGLSNGGHMAYRLAFEAPDLIAAAAPVIANLPVADNLDCEPAGEAVPMLILNGTEDPISPYGGGLVVLPGDSSRGEVQSSEASAQYWAEQAGYSKEGERRDLPLSNSKDDTSLHSLRWQGENRVPVELITVRGGGHTFPNPVYRAPRVLGPTSHQADGAELIWNFFDTL